MSRYPIDQIKQTRHISKENEADSVDALISGAPAPIVSLTHSSIVWFTQLGMGTCEVGFA